MSYRDRRDADARLVILQMLRKEPNQTMRDAYVADALAVAPLYMTKTIPAVRQLCRQIADVGGVQIREIEGVFLVTLTEAGRSHLDETLALDGVTRVPELR